MRPVIREEELKMDEDAEPPKMAKNYMDSGMYKAAREGNFPDLENSIRQKHRGNTEEEEALLLETHKGNNLIHLAAESGQKDFIQLVLHKCPKLAAKPNSHGDTPLHVAARTGRHDIVEAILSKAEPHKGTNNSLLRLKNNGGNTALHEALRNGDSIMGTYLWEQDKETAGSVNESGESALYVAAASGVESLVKKMVEYLKHGGGARVWDGALSGPDGENPLHAAALAGNIGCVEALIDFDGPNMINKRDNNGRTPLHFAAQAEAEDIAARLLQTYPSSASVKDINGRTPLLEAASSGHLGVLREILKHCPDTVEISDKEGRNAVHLALKWEPSRSEAVLKEPELMRLVNEADHGGNTPLHMAAEDLNHRMVKRLLKMPQVNLRAKNAAGLTFLDICESRWQYTKELECLYQYLEPLPPGQKPHTWNHSDKHPTPLDKPEADLKGHANALSVVATLLATITLAAALKFPGDNDIGTPAPRPSPLCNFPDPPDGHLKPVHSICTAVFILADVLAASTSLTVLFILIAAMLDDDAALRRTIVYSRKLLYLSLGGTLVAFMTGLYSIIPTEWLGYAVWVIGSSVPFLISYFRFKSFTSTPVFLRRFLSKKGSKKPWSSSGNERSGNEFESFDDILNKNESIRIYLGPLSNRFSSRRSQ